MAFDYAALAFDAAALITEFGLATTLTRPGVSSYAPATGAVTATPVVVSVLAVVLPIDDRRIDGTLVLVNDKTAYIAASGLAEPKPGDVLLWAGASLTVVRCVNLAPAAVAVLYEAQVRA